MFQVDNPVKLTFGFRLAEQTCTVGNEEGGCRRATGLWTGRELVCPAYEPWFPGCAWCHQRRGSRGIQGEGSITVVRKRCGTSVHCGHSYYIFFLE